MLNHTRLCSAAVLLVLAGAGPAFGSEPAKPMVMPGVGEKPRELPKLPQQPKPATGDKPIVMPKETPHELPKLPTTPKPVVVEKPIEMPKTSREAPKTPEKPKPVSGDTGKATVAAKVAGRK